MLDPAQVNLSELATALASRDDYDVQWFLDADSGDVVLWTRDFGIDGEPVELDEVDLVPIEALPSAVWYEDMADFAAHVGDERARQRLGRAIQGRGAFRRFKDELHQEFPELVPVWRSFEQVQAERRAVAWLVDQELVSEQAADQFLAAQPDPFAELRSAVRSDYPRLLHTVLDTTDVRRLAEFYRELLGLSYRPGDEPPASPSADTADWLVLTESDGTRRLAFQQVDELRRTTWPSPEVPMQLHLDMTVPTVDDLERQRSRAEQLGAELLLDRSRDPDEPLYVLADPAGHPFCIFVA